VVFCRLRYRLTLRDLSEIMLLRGFTVSHECVRQWEAKLLPVMGEALRKRRHGTGRSSGQSWYVGETYLKVHGRWCYLYRAIDRDGNLPHRHDAERHSRHKSGAEVLPLGTVSCRLCARPGDNRRA
jgi:transposase-like protein